MIQSLSTLQTQFRVVLEDHPEYPSYQWVWPEAMELAPKFDLGQRIKVIDGPYGGSVGRISGIAHASETLSLALDYANGRRGYCVTLKPDQVIPEPPVETPKQVKLWYNNYENAYAPGKTETACSTVKQVWDAFRHTWHMSSKEYGVDVEASIGASLLPIPADHKLLGGENVKFIDIKKETNPKFPVGQKVLIRNTTGLTGHGEIGTVAEKRLGSMTGKRVWVMLSSGNTYHYSPDDLTPQEKPAASHFIRESAAYGGDWQVKCSCGDTFTAATSTDTMESFWGHIAGIGHIYSAVIRPHNGYLHPICSCGWEAPQGVSFLNPGQAKEDWQVHLINGKDR